MIFTAIVPADLVQLITFFKHLFEMVRKAYPSVETSEFPITEDTK